MEHSLLDYELNLKKWKPDNNTNSSINSIEEPIRASLGIYPKIKEDNKMEEMTLDDSKKLRMRKEKMLSDFLHQKKKQTKEIESEIE